jgi:hypothetical protein
LSRRQHDTLFERKKNVKPAQFFRVIDGGKSFEMKNRLAAMVLAEPAGFYGMPARLGITTSEKHFAEQRKALGKIREEFGGDFALVAAGAKDVGNDDPAWSFAAQWIWGFASVNLPESRA